MKLLIYESYISTDACLYIFSAMDRFRNLDKKKAAGVETATALGTQHQNTIT